MSSITLGRVGWMSPVHDAKGELEAPVAPVADDVAREQRDETTA